MMNLELKEVVKEELQKLLDVNFIYPISISRWVSPLVLVPKNNGKLCICIYYRELRKSTMRDYFPLPFVDQVLDTLVRKKYFSFLDGFSAYNPIQIAPKGPTENHIYIRRGIFPTVCCPLVCVMPLPPF